MANPQKENGYTPIANEILEILTLIPFSPGQLRIILFIIRKTYGYHKKEDMISFSQFEEGLGIHRTNIARQIKQLEEDNVLLVNRDGYINTYGFNKRYLEWGSSANATSSATATESSSASATETSSATATYKRYKDIKDICQQVRNKNFMKGYEEPSIDYDTNEVAETAVGKRKKVLRLYRKLMELVDEKQGSVFSKNPARHYRALDNINHAGFDYPDIRDRFLDMRREEFWRDKNISFESIHKSLERKPPKK